MAQEGDIVFVVGADVAGLTKGGQQGTKALADLEREAKTLERQLGKIGQAGVDFQRQMNALTGVTKEVSKSARDSAAAFEAFDRSRAQVDALRASIDPLFAASKRCEQALHTLDAALEQGAISARQHAAMTDQLAAAYLRVDGAANGLGGRFAFLTRNAQGGAGGVQNLGYQIQDFAVQVGAGTSATQAFAQQFPQMASGFGPWGVAIGTLAAVGIPLLVAAFGSASEEADGFTEAAKRQKESLDALADTTNRLALERAMLFSGAQTEDEQRQLDKVRELTEQRAKAQAELNRLVNIGGRAAVFAQEAQAKRDALQAEIAMIDAELKRLARQREILAAAKENKALIETMRGIMDQLGRADISGPWQNVLGSIQNAIDKAREYAATHMSLGKTYGVVGARGDPRDFGANPGTSNTFDTENFPVPDFGGGGGGGGGGGQNPIEAQLEALRQQMMTEEQIEMESFAKRQEMLQQALAQRLITQQEYAALMEQSQQQHADKMSEIDVWRYGTGLDKAQAFLGGMASALQGGNEKMLAISKKFAAAEALINAWKGFSDVLADKSLPFWAKIPAAMKVLAAGMGAVNAIKGGGRGSATAGGGAATQQAAPQQPVQTMNLHFQNDPWGVAERTARQISTMVNSAARNGMIIQTNVVAQ